MAFNPSECGLRAVGSNIEFSNRRNFGPQAFQARSQIVIMCSVEDCLLRNPKKIKGPSYGGRSEEEIKGIVERDIKDENSLAGAAIQAARLKNCPLYRQKFSSQAS